MERQTWLSARVLNILAALSLYTLSAQAQEVAPARLDDAARRAVVKSAAEALRRGYVFPDVGERAAEAIETALSDGRYDQALEPAEFARRLAVDLQGVTHDKHVTMRAPSPMPTNGLGAVRPTPFRDDWGIGRADRLDDNIGYLEILGYGEVEGFRPALDRAMAALAKTRALIIDERRNGGGSAASEVYLASYFVKGREPVLLNRFIRRKTGTQTFTTEEFWSSPTPFSYAGKPVYVLTSGNTFSAAEALAYDMHALGLVVIVGEQSRGGANPGAEVPLGHGFALNVPTGRSENPITHTNWEGVGVTPDVRTPAAEALNVALQKLGLSPRHREIDDLSRDVVFVPRIARQPATEAATEAALRREVEGLASGEPPYDLMTEAVARSTRERLPALHEEATRWGAIKTIRFLNTDPHGVDRFAVTFENGTFTWTMALDEDGKIVWARWSPRP